MSAVYFKVDVWFKIHKKLSKTAKLAQIHKKPQSPEAPLAFANVFHIFLAFTFFEFIIRLIVFSEIAGLWNRHNMIKTPTSLSLIPVIEEAIWIQAVEVSPNSKTHNCE